MKRLFLLLLPALLPAIAIAAPWDIDSIASIFAGRMPDPIEGVWQFPADGASIFIEKKTATTYDIKILDSPMLDVRPGICIGTAVATPSSSTFDAHLDAKKIGNKRLKKADAILTLVDGHLCIRPYSTGKKIALWRWIPYFFRVSVYNDNTRPSNLDGAEKVYPIDESMLHPCL